MDDLVIANTEMKKPNENVKIEEKYSDLGV